MRLVRAEMTFGVFAAASVAVSGFSSRAPNHYSKSAACALRLWLSLLIRSRFVVFCARLAESLSADTRERGRAIFSKPRTAIAEKHEKQAVVAVVRPCAILTTLSHLPAL